MTCNLAALLYLCLLAVLPQAAAIAGGPDDPPIVGRPDRFSNIVGKYELQVSAEPTEVRVEEPITLRIRIIGSGPAKYEPDRKHLQILPDWTDDFFVQEMREEHRVERDKKTWLFVYRLKPKHARVNVIDDIKLVFYDPKEGFLTIEADPIKITVKPKPQDLSIKEPLAAVPERFFQCAPSAEIVGRTAPFDPGVGLLTAVLLGVPLACFVGALGWRRLYPDARTLHDRRRSQAAARALADLHAGRGTPWSVACRYLRERFDFAAQDAAPGEVARFLKRRGFALERCAEAENFFKSCDAARFTAATAPTPNRSPMRRAD